MNTRKLVIPAVVLGAGLALAAPLAASAHVHANPESIPAGTASPVTFAFGHGCEASPTTSLTFTIPEGIDAVAPVVDAAWTITDTRAAADADGVERIETVTYTAVAPVPSDYYAEVTLRLTPSEDAVGRTLAVPVVQQCADGVNDWSDDPADESEGSMPAPAVTVAEAASGDAHAHATTGAEEAEHQDAAAGSGGSGLAANVLGISGLVVSVVALVTAISARRKPASK